MKRNYEGLTFSSEKKVYQTFTKKSQKFLDLKKNEFRYISSPDINEK